MAVWPNVIEEENGVKRAYDIPSRLLMDRIIMLTDEINSATANSIIGQLLFLEKEDNKKPITLYINSPGGSVTDGFAIYDVIHQIKCPVNTICMGMAASMAAFLLAAGTGKRYATENSTIMIHQPMGGTRGQATDITIYTNYILNLKKKLNSILAEKTRQKYETIQEYTERDKYFNAEDAKNFGLIDKVYRRKNNV